MAANNKNKQVTWNMTSNGMAAASCIVSGAVLACAPQQISTPARLEQQLRGKLAWVQTPANDFCG